MYSIFTPSVYTAAIVNLHRTEKWKLDMTTNKSVTKNFPRRKQKETQFGLVVA